VSESPLAAGHALVSRAGVPASPAQVRQRFLSQVSAAERWLTREGIPHAALGSLACWAYAGPDSAPEFGRAYAFSAVQRCPDIDVLVPRTAVAVVTRYSRSARRDPFPVAVDVSGAACFIDWRPDAETSYLTHRRLRFAVPSGLFAPQPAHLPGIEITTIDPRVLLHTFGAIGGIIRHKDGPKIAVLTRALEAGTAVSRFSEDDCAVFARYTGERDRRYPAYRAFVRLVDDMLDAVPPAVASGIRYFMMPAAKKTLARWNRTRAVNG
jgi:hypothetical protein